MKNHNLWLPSFFRTLKSNYATISKLHNNIEVLGTLNKKIPNMYDIYYIYLYYPSRNKYIVLSFPNNLPYFMEGQQSLEFIYVLSDPVKDIIKALTTENDDAKQNILNSRHISIDILNLYSSKSKNVIKYPIGFLVQYGDMYRYLQHHTGINSAKERSQKYIKKCADIGIEITAETVFNTGGSWRNIVFYPEKVNPLKPCGNAESKDNSSVLLVDNHSDVLSKEESSIDIINCTKKLIGWLGEKHKQDSELMSVNYENKVYY